jgi:localization factor PodJL
MAAQGNATTGRLSASAAERDAAWDSRAADTASEHDAGPDIPQSEEFGVDDASSIFGAGQSEAEAQLYAYLNRATSPRPSGFAPYEELTARLNEFPPAVRPSGEGIDPVRFTAQKKQDLPYPRNRSEDDSSWADGRFEELKRLIINRDEDRNEFVAIHSKLADIAERVETLAASLPSEKTLASMETRLAALSSSLEATRQQNANNSDRISRAAREILAVTDRIEAVRAGFEIAATHTVKELGQTVVVASSRAGVMAAEHVAGVFRETNEKSGLERLEGELRALHSQSRKSSERTAVAIEGVHETLRVFLEQNSTKGSATPVRKRPGVHMPIAAGAPAYTRPDAIFGSEPARKPQLDTITLRTPPPPDDNFIKALQEADEKLTTTRTHSSEGRNAPIRSRPSASPVFSMLPMFRDEERSLPLFGLGIVAIVLLLASAALYYLHTRTHIAPFHLTVLPQTETLTAFVKPPLPSPKIAAQAAGAGKSASSGSGGFPALLTAAEQNRQSTSPVHENESEDTQLLTNSASRGDRDAQFRIGARFLREGPLQADAAAAARWFARAADQGHTEAMFVLASLYERGVGVPKQESHAIALYRKAAKAGHIRAMHNLGVMLSAKDTALDYKEAASWFAAAASAGVTESQYNIALLYERGLGLEESPSKAYFWYKVAAAAGDKEALQNVERLKRLLPASEMQTVAEQAGAWRPITENSRQHSAENAPG